MMSKENYDGEEGIEALISGNNNNNNNNNPTIDFGNLNFQNLHHSVAPPLHHQEIIVSGFENSSSSSSNRPLLKLTRTPSFNEAFMLVAASQDQQHVFDNVPSHHQPLTEKTKASNFPILSLKIGPWQMSSKNEGDLIAKVYYAKQKLVWEILDGPTKKKIEIQWSDISGIKAIMNDDNNQPGNWMIELDKAPSFFSEINPQPRKHTVWQSTNDFTQGHVASIWRVHCVSCSSGVLNKHYEKLLHSSQKLFELSRNPFPTVESHFFNFGPSTLIPRFEFQNHPIMIGTNSLNQYEGMMRMLSMMNATNNQVLRPTINNNWDHNNHHHQIHHASMEPNQIHQAYYQHQQHMSVPLLEHHGNEANEAIPLLEEEHHQLLSSLLNLDDNNNNNNSADQSDNKDNLFHGDLYPYR